jgi:Na+-driven multidrug efflux pump
MSISMRNSENRKLFQQIYNMVDSVVVGKGAHIYLVIMFLGTLANCTYNGMSAVLRHWGILFLGLVFVFQNFLRSAGDVTPTVWMSIMEIAARSFLAFLFSWLWGYGGIWWATPVGWLGSLLIGYVRYRTGKWKRKIKI